MDMGGGHAEKNHVEMVKRTKHANTNRRFAGEIVAGTSSLSWRLHAKRENLAHTCRVVVDQTNASTEHPVRRQKNHGRH